MDKYSNNAAVSHLQIPVSDKNTVTELSGDFTLPDYQPEIKRLLRVGAAVLPPSKYIGDRDAELAGSVDYYVYYVGSDDMPYCAPVTAEYKINVPLEGEGEESGGFLTSLTALADIVPDMISGRVTAPRKLSIKCRLRSRVQVFGLMALEDGYTHGDNGLQVLRGRVSESKFLRGSGESFHVTDEMICDSRGGEERVVSAEGRVLMSEISAIDGGVICRGDVFVKLLLCREEEGMPYTALRKLPFSSTVPIEGAMRGDSVTATGSVCEMGITVEDNRIGIDAGIMLEAQAAHSDEVEYVKDVYSVSRRCANGYKTVEIPRDASCFVGNFTLSDSMSLDESGLAHGARIIDASGSAVAEEYSFDGERCTVSGRARLALLTEKDGEFSSSEIELPFTYRVGGVGGADRAVCACEVVSVRAKADGERVGIDAEIGVSGLAYTLARESLLSGVAFGDEIESPRGEIVVSYPSDSDTVWSVAKRYGVELNKLRSANGIGADIPSDSRESLADVSFLVI